MSEQEKGAGARSSAILGAAFLMATSAVGPGFLTQTTFFTRQLLASFGFVILLSIILDIFAQLNIWRVLVISGLRGQDLANRTLSGSGYFLAALIFLGGLVFNIGNIAGCGLGLNVLLGIPVEAGAVASALIGIGLFVVKEAGRAMDAFVKILGVAMIGLIVYVVFVSRPPLAEAAFRTFLPLQIDAHAIVTLVGGTVGGYITFAGAHRLIDAGITGTGSIAKVNRSSVTGILLTAVIRFLLFLAALGVISQGLPIDDANPPASVFSGAAGDVGLRLFGMVMWAAAITSVVGAAFTSVSFVKTLHPAIERRSSFVIAGFIAFSAAIFLLIGRPVGILVWAGTVNGFILPFGLAIVLIASRKSELMKGYEHPVALQAAGWFVVAVMLAFSVQTLISAI
jgi:Mn2+/Fe2+ NRAMP family transporter